MAIQPLRRWLPALVTLLGFALMNSAQAQCPYAKRSAPAPQASANDPTRQERAFKCRGPNGEIQISDTGCFGKTPAMEKSRTASITSLEQSGVGQQRSKTAAR